MLRRRLVLVTAIASIALLPVAGVDANQSLNEQIKLVITDPAGSPLEGSEVRVYLFPFDPPPQFQPPELARGVTDSSGAFGFTLDPGAPEFVGTEPLGHSPEGVVDRFNAIVRAVDPTHKWLVHWSVILPLTRPHEEVIAANVDLEGSEPDASAATADDLIGIDGIECVPSEDPDGEDPSLDEVEDDTGESDEDPDEGDAGGSQDDPLDGWDDATDPALSTPEETTHDLCDVDLDSLEDPADDAGDGAFSGKIVGKPRTRWVKILQFHSAPGIRARFGFRVGKNTTTQVGFKWGGASWRVGGWALEHRTRDSGGSVTKRHGYHRVRFAKYVYRKWKFYKCAQYQPSPPYGHPTCSYWRTAYEWRPHVFTGGLSKQSNWRASSPALTGYRIELRDNDFWRQRGRNARFGVGVRIVGLELKAETGYSNITRMVWRPVSGCSKTRWLYGKNAWPTQARTVYARCT